MATPTGYAYKLRQVQVGKESTFNTAVAATAILSQLTNAEFELDAPLEVVAQIGTLSPGTGADVLSTLGRMTLEGTLTYEDAPFYYQCAGVVAPTGAGPYVRDYDAPTAAYSPASSTFEFGIKGNNKVYKLSGTLLTSFEVTGAAKGFITFKATYEGATIAEVSSFTGSLTERTLTKMRFADLALYIDAFGATPGTTRVSSTLYDFKLSVTTNVHMKTFDGSIAPTDFGINGWETSLETTMEVNATTQGYITSLVAGNATTKLVQFKATRATQIDVTTFAGALRGDGQKLYEDMNGNAVVKFTFSGLEDTTLGTFLQWSNTSTVASLPF